VGTALATAEEVGRPLLESVECIDDYRDPRLGEGRKSWTFRLTYRADDRTLTGAEVQLVHDAIAAALQVRCHAEVRR
jgi:phenylalanyl-tRNA synthetase beta chain